MNPDVYSRVKQIFNRAIQLNERARRQFVVEACGNDSELRAEVESLLEFHREPDEPTNLQLAQESE